MPYRWMNVAEGPEVDTVTELEAGLRSVSAAGPRTSGAERRIRILESLDDRGAVRVSTLSATLGVSEMTVRRDLDGLHADGLVVRVFGGAMRPADCNAGLLRARAALARGDSVVR